MSLLVAAGALALPGCGGRAVSRALTSAEPPPVTEWEHPSRMGDARPAVRLDRPGAPSPDGEPSGCEDDCGEAATAPHPGEEGRAAGRTGGVHVSLQPGMTLYSLARAYQVPLQTIMQLNGISDPTTLRAGVEILVPASPGPEPPPAAVQRAPRGSGKNTRTVKTSALPPGADKGSSTSFMSIAWPLDGRITGAFGQRGRHHHHDGIDIDGVRGEEVRAVAAGIVVHSGSEGKYGKTVVIDHGNGVTTLYAHASRLLVRDGDEVGQGETIAEVGATGNARGTHLHFEVRRNGQPVDPLPYLKPEMMGAASR